MKWAAPVTHSEENIGSTENCALIVELKGLVNPASRPGRSPESRSSWEKLPRGFYTVLLENEDARVVRACLKPGETIPMHSYRFPRVVYYLTSHAARFTFPSTPPVESHSAAGQVRWATTRTPHSEENIGRAESCALIIELKR